MEEADSFIKEACKHLECSFAYDDEIEFTTPQIFEFLVRCIWKIDSSSKRVLSSYVYPKVITSRLHLGNDISNYLQKFHIRGDTALHTVLYGNINNLRSAFIELIRKLPSETAEKHDQDRSHAFFVRTIGIMDSQPGWVPVYCRGLDKSRPWFPADNQPEKFLLSMADDSTSHKDPRKWIAQNITANDSGHSAKPRRPPLPPKPAFSQRNSKAEQKAENEVIDEKVENDRDVDQYTLYDQKLKEYKELRERHAEAQQECDEITEKLSKYDPMLIEALKDPQAYAEQLLAKIADLNRQIDEDTEKIEKRKKEAVQRKLEMAEELKQKGIVAEDMRRAEEIEMATIGMTEKAKSNELLAQKLMKKLDDKDEDKFDEYEQRSSELNELIWKQENSLFEMQEERMALRKQQERENEAVNRSFAIIYNILLQHCDHYRGRLAMESFTRIHLYCMEIMEMLRENGALKQTIGYLQSEIDDERRKQYDSQLQLLNRDYQEVLNLNEQLISKIKSRNPDFKPPML